MGQSGNPSRHHVTKPPPGGFAAISAGIDACGVGSDGAVACTGYAREVPPGPFSAVSTSWKHACGLRPDGTVECWGDNTHGQADAPQGRFRAVCADDIISAGVCRGTNLLRACRWDKLAVGGIVACGVRVEGTVACNSGLWTPPELFDSVAVGWDHACGVRLDGSVAC